MRNVIFLRDFSKHYWMIFSTHMNELMFNCMPQICLADIIRIYAPNLPEVSPEKMLVRKQNANLFLNETKKKTNKS